ncbi:MAG TPA: hypothetical protein VFJ91_06465 [Gaiellaceae bacterium]|nr:hypothetical protein [Gaiellaceae bacterium]
MSPRGWIAVLVLVVAAAVLGVALLPPVAGRLGYATPFSLPDSVSYRGRDYIQPVCSSEAEARRRGDLPFRRVGSIAGFLTGRVPLLLPHSELDSLTAPPRSLRSTPVVLYARGHCLAAYGLSGGP